MKFGELGVSRVTAANAREPDDDGVVDCDNATTTARKIAFALFGAPADIECIEHVVRNETAISLTPARDVAFGKTAAELTREVGDPRYEG